MVVLSCRWKVRSIELVESPGEEPRRTVVLLSLPMPRRAAAELGACPGPAGAIRLEGLSPAEASPFQLGAVYLVEFQPLKRPDPE